MRRARPKPNSLGGAQRGEPPPSAPPLPSTWPCAGLGPTGTVSRLATVRGAPGRPRLAREVADGVLQALPASGWDVAQAASAAGVSRSEADRALRDNRLGHTALFGGKRVGARRIYSDDDFVTALRSVAALRGGDCSAPISFEQYRRLRRGNGQRVVSKCVQSCNAGGEQRLPSEGAIIARYGSWSAACSAAGLHASERLSRFPALKSRFGAPTYEREDLIAAVAEYVVHADVEQAIAHRRYSHDTQYSQDTQCS